MQSRETSVHGIAVSITSLRNARIGLAAAPKPHDKLSFKARIELCDELISKVGEIDRNLRRLSLDVRRTLTDGAHVQHQRDQGR